MCSLKASRPLTARFGFLLSVFLLQRISLTSASNKFGLSHNCEGQSVCNSDTIYCVDSKNSAAVCNITCAGLYACAQATFVVANSGGLVLNCLGDYACQASTIEWVNSDNLHNYTAINSSAAIGGPLRVLHCGDEVDAEGYACASMSVNGDTQEQGLDTTTEWNCVAFGSCQTANGKFKGAVSIHCNETDSCLDTNVTCLSGGNCRTKSNKESASNGATMYCMPGVQYCECGNYWDCITLTAAPIPTSTRIQTTTTAQSTSITETPHTTMATSTTKFPDDDKDNSKLIDNVIFVAVIILVVFGLLAALSYFVYRRYFQKEKRRDKRFSSKAAAERKQLAKKKEPVAVSEAPRVVESVPIGEVTAGGPVGVSNEVICLYESDEEWQ